LRHFMQLNSKSHKMIMAGQKRKFSDFKPPCQAS
jgi:hypothetical protein